MQKTISSKRAADILQHAEWHCLFGSQASDRVPTVGDIEAARILKQLRLELLGQK